ncbi:MAG: hypothetical protein US50_C0015G0006 [Candidatus Nomurabacteria bacterium GW2011_GWB1_37_5]|uniref:Rubrerythrin diiron-binding domain-containing protein n=1 Tax=Candidatus Nomurabacteria bacterium GW2011_GWB1_37_5 TaxID=1618742 RepID=A0A0G0JF76_9BACT|nr:MAG: hypothetical protein US50_C0015G0006 [Candidatus Nomurabacteria bacterium GW2011_GWB1_37_5]
MANNNIHKYLSAQKKEITEYFVYLRLAERSKSIDAKKILNEIANQEKKHYDILKSITGREIKPSNLTIGLYILISRIFGLNFSLQLMERGERVSSSFYESISDSSDALKMMEEEREHEKKLISLIDDKRIEHMGSFVLGLNDALVELTGALAGLTLALNNTNLIAMVGLITGIAASLSMAVSSYLAAKEDDKKDALSAGSITGTAYIFTVLLLISPFFIFTKSIIALIFTLILAIAVIALFTFYAAVAKRINFAPKFVKMAVISLSVAIINFGIGFIIKKYLGVEV